MSKTINYIALIFAINNTFSAEILSNRNENTYIDTKQLDDFPQNLYEAQKQNFTKNYLKKFKPTGTWLNDILNFTYDQTNIFLDPLAQSDNINFPDIEFNSKAEKIITLGKLIIKDMFYTLKDIKRDINWKTISDILIHSTTNIKIQYYEYCTQDLLKKHNLKKSDYLPYEIRATIEQQKSSSYVLTSKASKMLENIGIQRFIIESIDDILTSKTMHITCDSMQFQF